MDITVVEGTSEGGVLCEQKFAVMSADDTAVGTTAMFNCTGLLLLPQTGQSACVLAHVEARTGADPYQECIRVALLLMLQQMKKTTAAGMSLVLLGNGAASLGGGTENRAASLLAILKKLKFAEAQILDMRNGARYSVGAARLTSTTGLPTTIGACVFTPRTRTLAVFGYGVPTAQAGAPFRIQDDHGAALGSQTGHIPVVKNTFCVIL